MSLSQALATSVSGLRVTQAGLALVASNVANAQTPGYIRKTMDQVALQTGGLGNAVPRSFRRHFKNPKQNQQFEGMGEAVYGRILSLSHHRHRYISDRARGKLAGGNT